MDPKATIKRAEKIAKEKQSAKAKHENPERKVKEKKPTKNRNQGPSQVVYTLQPFGIRSLENFLEAKIDK